MTTFRGKKTWLKIHLSSWQVWRLNWCEITRLHCITHSSNKYTLAFSALEDRISHSFVDGPWRPSTNQKLYPNWNFCIRIVFLKEMLSIPLFAFTNEFATLGCHFSQFFSIIYDLVDNTGCLLHFTAPHLCHTFFSKTSVLDVQTNNIDAFNLEPYCKAC